MADRFSTIAEAHNLLEYPQVQWSNKPYPVSLELFGLVKAEGIFDTRQNFTLRDGQFLYFPLNKRPDILNHDIHARGSFDAFAIETRLDFKGNGPCIGAYESGFLIEGDFFGRTDTTINEFELLLAFLELRSECLEFLAGQNYHPLVFPFESPNTISRNSGVPIAPFALCPQCKVTYKTPGLEFLAAAIGFIGERPFGIAGADDKVFRDALMPDFYAQIRLNNEINYVGLGFDMMRIVPRLVTNKGYKEIHPLTALSATVFARFEYNNLITYFKGVYSNNASTFELIGGFAVASQNPLTDIRTYTPLRTFSFFGECIRPGNFEPAIFIGIVKNLGASRRIIPQLEQEVGVFGLGTNIGTVFRISPRVRWYINSFIVGIEYEYTRATYGILNNFGQVVHTTPIANNRLLFATYYIF